MCTYVYYMILLYLEGSGSKFHSVSTKTNQFSPFLDFRSWEKTCIYTYIYIICKYVHMYITWFCYIWRVVVLSFIPSTPKLANFPFFWIPRVEKNIYIYIYMCVYFQQFPRILWVAQLPMGFHLAPKTPVDAGNAMFSHQTFVLCSISAPDFCKTRDMYIYIYMHVYSNPFQRRHCFQGHLYISISYPLFWYMPMIPSFYISKCTLHIHIIYIYKLIYYIIPSSSPKI